MEIERDAAVLSLLHVTPRIVRILVWLVFSTIHLALAVILLALLWAFQVQPADIGSALQAFSQTRLGSSTAGMIGFLGLSGFAALLAYVRAWRWILRHLLSEWTVRGLGEGD